MAAAERLIIFKGDVMSIRGAGVPECLEGCSWIAENDLDGDMRASVTLKGPYVDADCTELYHAKKDTYRRR